MHHPSRCSAYTTTASRQELGRKTGTEANIILEGECFFILVNISRSNQNRSAIWNTACCVPSVTGQQSLRRGTANWKGRLVFAGGGSGKRNCLRRLPSCVSRMVVVTILACPIPPPDPTPEYHQAILQFSFPSSMQIGEGKKQIETRKHENHLNALRRAYTGLCMLSGPGHHFDGDSKRRGTRKGGTAHPM